MLNRDDFSSNMELVAQIDPHLDGALVECGTWKGGAIAGMFEVSGRTRKCVLFDSFAGLPPAEEIDGKMALDWEQAKDAPNYFDGCKAAKQDAIRALETVGCTDYLIFEGWFHETLKEFPSDLKIAVLRLDADWYKSTMEVLEVLFDRVSKGGMVIIDDYYVWDGCAQALHDYLSKHKSTARIASHRGVCFIRM